MLTTRYIEDILMKSHLVHEVCVLAGASEDSENLYYAFVVPINRGPAELYETQCHLQEILKELPVKLEFLGELPKTSLGRVALDALRNLTTAK